MPKDKSNYASATQKSRHHPYVKPYSRKGKAQVEGESSKVSSGRNEWKDALCSICMEIPHNAVLLICSSHDKGCRPYICNTSHRHSNCLDRYQKAQLGQVKTCASRTATESSSGGQALESSVRRLQTVSDNGSIRANTRNDLSDGVTEAIMMHREDLESISIDQEDECTDREVEHGGSTSLNVSGHGVKGLICPLCREKVKGWKVVNSARDYLNHTARICAHESCSFEGNYEELRVHARREHPLARPTEIDPMRQRSWSRMERRRDMGDVLSIIHSTIPGATVMGDYVIEHDEEGEGEDGADFPGDDGHWWTVFLLFQIFGPSSSNITNEGMRLRSQSRVPRRSLWGESLPRSGHVDALTSSESSDHEEQVRRSSRRQQRNRHRANR